MREIERRIQRVEAHNTSGEPRELPEAPVGVPDSFDEHVKLMFDLQALAFAVRHHARLLVQDGPRRLEPRLPGERRQHARSTRRRTTASARSASSQFAKINSYHVSLLPYFLEKLKETPDGDSNLLDNTLVIYGSPMGNSNVHNHKRCPLFLAGHAGGQLKGGLHLKAADGTPMANALLTLLHDARAWTICKSFGDSTAAMRSERRVETTVVVRVAVAPVRVRAMRVPVQYRVEIDGLQTDSADLHCETCTGRWRVCLPRRAAQQATRRSPSGDARATGTRCGRCSSRACDVNAAQGDGMTALHWAAMKGDAELAQMLIYAGAQREGDDAARRLHAAAISPPAAATPTSIAALARGRRRREGRDHQRHDAADAGGGRGRCDAVTTAARERRRREREGDGASGETPLDVRRPATTAPTRSSCSLARGADPQR